VQSRADAESLRALQRATHHTLQTITASLADLDLSGPVGEHADGFQQVHAVLQQVLNPDAGAPPR